MIRAVGGDRIRKAFYFLRTVLRMLGLTIALVLVVGSAIVIVADRPGSARQLDVIAPYYSCPPRTTLAMVRVPDIQLILQPGGGYDENVSADIAWVGNGLCHVSLNLPSKFIPDNNYGNPEGAINTTIKTIRPQGFVASVKVVEVTAPRYSKALEEVPPSHYLDYTFSSEGDTYRTGWGEEGFTVVTATLPGTSPLPVTGAPALPAFPYLGETKSSFDLTLDCPFRDNIANEYPNNAMVTSYDEAVWQVQQTGLGEFFTGSCQNPNIRFWVGHATDALVLGLGTLLGVIITRDDDKRVARLKRRKVDSSGRKEADGVNPAPAVPFAAQQPRMETAILAPMTDELYDPLIKRRQAVGMEQWPYGIREGPQQEKMLEWAERNHLRFSDTNRICVHWLLAGRANYIARRYTKTGSEISDSIHYSSCHHSYGFDHVTCWTRDGKPAVLVSQPYHISDENMKMLKALEHDGLTVQIHKDGWYGSQTLCVEIWAVKPE
jgi:hypothetical protein